MKKYSLLIIAFLFFTYLSAQSNFTLIPDRNFEQALIDAGVDPDIDIDGIVFTRNIESIKELNIANKDIKNLTGIEGFRDLEKLNCSQNKDLTTIDISNNSKLIELKCTSNSLNNLDLSSNSDLMLVFADANNLTSIDLSKNTKLEHLSLFRNSLESLDLSNNSKLKIVSSSFNNLTSIDLSKNIELQRLTINNNDLEFIDLSNNMQLDFLLISNNVLAALDLSQNTLLETALCNNNKLTELNLTNRTRTSNSLINLDVTGNPDLSCIIVSQSLIDAPFFPLSLWKKDDAAFYNTDCRITSIPDRFFERSLIDKNIDKDQTINGRVFTTNIETIKELDITARSIEDLTGIEDFKELEKLSCTGARRLEKFNFSNNLELKVLNIGETGIDNLDISKNVKLESLTAFRNNLVFLDVSNNTLLTTLRINNNFLSSLDISKNGVLEELNCHSNELTILNLKDDTPFFNALQSMNATNNPDLNCIQTPQGLLNSIPTDWKKDTSATYSENCNFLSIDDFSDTNTFVIYPNPSSGVFNINSNMFIDKIEVFNSNGTVIKTISKKHHFTSQEVELPNISRGIYFIKISALKSIVTKRIVIK